MLHGLPFAPSFAPVSDITNLRGGSIKTSATSLELCVLSTTERSDAKWMKIIIQWTEGEMRPTSALYSPTNYGSFPYSSEGAWRVRGCRGRI